jgi:hypothetical protein
MVDTGINNGQSLLIMGLYWASREAIRSSFYGWTNPQIFLADFPS